MSAFLEILKAWGPLGALLVSFIDGVGLPNPGGPDYLVLFLGWKQPQTAMLSGALAVAGALAGSMILFFIARRGGQRYLDQKASGPRALRFRAWFQRYGLVTVFIPAMIPVIPLPMKVFVICAGTLAVHPLAFFLVMLLGKTIRYMGLAYLGRQLGEQGAKAWLVGHRWHFVLGAVALMASLILLVKVVDWFRSKPRTLTAGG
jgi:membrane protein DedA with SNARE-associated domain